MIIDDIRQSDAWSNYLKMYGWTTHKLLNGGVLRTAKYPLFSVAKIHRANSLIAADLQEAESVYRENSVVYAKISPSISQDLTSLEKFGYRRSGGIDLPPRTIYLDLRQSEDVLWGKLTKDCRYAINRSTRETDRIEIIQTPTTEQLKTAYSVIKNRSREKGYFVPSIADFTEKFKCFGEEAFVSNAYSSEGGVLGVKIFLGYKGCIWYMYSGITRMGITSNANYKLMWEVVRYFKLRGYSVMDMEGLADNRLKRQTTRWNNYSDYKLQFGGTTIEFPLPYSRYPLFGRMRLHADRDN
jgi:lipid II:glycine glycyltransferase (peptidoglycan interpeptide bridge formation enzyme)